MMIVYDVLSTGGQKFTEPDLEAVYDYQSEAV